jgi:hypothetical protein
LYGNGSFCEESIGSYRNGTGDASDLLNHGDGVEATGMVARVGVKVALIILESGESVSDDSSIWLKAS